MFIDHYLGFSVLKSCFWCYQNRLLKDYYAVLNYSSRLD